MSYPALGQLLDLVGLPTPEDGRIELRGSDPVFPTRFRIGTSGAAAIAAVAVAAADLWALRTGGSQHQSISVDVRHATAALRGAHYLRIDGQPSREIRDPLSGLYQARTERCVYLHCNFPNHRAAALEVLGLPAHTDREAVVQAVQAWDGLDLEDAVHAARGCAGFVRTTDEWSRHSQSAAVASLPLLEIERIGDAPPEPLREADRPLSGVRALDLTRVLAGPTCARTLAEHGADVLKVSGPHLPHSGDIEIDTGLGKLSTFLDLRQASDMQTLRSLVHDGRCDVFSQGYRPGTLAARGLSAEELMALRPGLVYVELSAWGRVGPWAQRRGFDTVVQCVSGMAMIEGGGARPRIMSVSAIDYVSGYLMALGAMVALERRAIEGGSWRVRVSLARTRQWIVEHGLLNPEAIEGIPNELPADEIARMTMETPSPLGLIRHLVPVAQMSMTPAGWARPPVALGNSAPVWPAQ